MKALSAQGISRDELPYKTGWQPYLAWYGFLWSTLICFVQGFTVFFKFNGAEFVSAYISLFLFFAMYFGHKIFFRTRWVDPAQADLVSGRKEIEGVVWENEKLTGWRRILSKILNFI
jgi:amino acid transporter